MHLVVGREQKFTLAIINGNTHRFEDRFLGAEGGTESEGWIIEAPVVHDLSLGEEERPRLALRVTALEKPVDSFCVYTTAEDRARALTAPR